MMTDSDKYENCVEISDPIEKAIKAKICVGDVFSNGWNQVYRTIGLDILGIKGLNGGKQKNSAKKKIVQYAKFSFIKPNGRALRCDDIFQEPRYLDKEKDGRGKKGKYIDRIIPLFVDIYRHEDTDAVCRIKIAGLSRQLGIVSRNYKILSQDQLKEIDSRYSVHMVSQFYSRCQAKLEEIIFSALDQLKKDYGVLEYRKTYMIKTESDTYEAHSLDEIIIEDAEKAVLPEFRSEKKSAVFFKGKADKYYERVVEYINNEHGTKWLRYWREIRIDFNTDAWKEFIDNQPARSSTEVDVLRKELRSSFSEYISNKTMRDYERNIEKAESEEGRYSDAKYRLEHGMILADDILKAIEYGVYKSKEEVVMMLHKPFKYNEDYVEIQNKLRRLLIEGVKDDNSAESRLPEKLSDILSNQVHSYP